MIPQISASTSVSTPIIQSSFAHLSQQSLRYGESTLTQSSVSKKTLIIIGFLAIGTFLVLMCRKMFSKKNEIQEWVKLNCGNFNKKHQEQISNVIARVKKKMERTANPNAVEIFDDLFMAIRNSEGFARVRPLVIQYFETHPMVPPTPTYKLAEDGEIRTWLTGRYKALSEEVIGQVISQVHEIERCPGCAKDPKAYILALRRNITLATTPGHLKAIAYLTLKHNVMGREKAK